MISKTILPPMTGAFEIDFDFRHFMRDVVILLGGERDIADLLDKSQDGVTEEDVRKVQNYACRLIDSHKDRLVALHQITIQVLPQNSP